MESPYMSFSLKLQIVRSLDQTTFFVDGIQWILGRHVKQLNKAVGEKDTCFQRILTLMLGKQVTYWLRGSVFETVTASKNLQYKQLQLVNNFIFFPEHKSNCGLESISKKD